jgi:hypothetical protein
VNHLVSIGKSTTMIRKFKRKRLPLPVLLQENYAPVIVLAKEPAGSSSQEPSSRQAPYMMASMLNPPSRANSSGRGIAADICPRTPPRLEVVFSADQTRYPVCPKLGRPQIPGGYVVQMGRDYFKQAVALTNAWAEDVYKYEKAENLERRFLWQNQSELHRLKYASPLLRATSYFKRYNPLVCRVTSR